MLSWKETRITVFHGIQSPPEDFSRPSMPRQPANQRRQQLFSYLHLFSICLENNKHLAYQEDRKCFLNIKIRESRMVNLLSWLLWRFYYISVIQNMYLHFMFICHFTKYWYKLLTEKLMEKLIFYLLCLFHVLNAKKNLLESISFCLFQYFTLFYFATVPSI